jgi:leucyl aminopeptidase (aminopeptidase T)
VLVLFRSNDFRHVPRERLGDGRLAAVACYSLSSADLVDRYLEVVLSTDYEAQRHFDRRFTQLLMSARSLRFASIQRAAELRALSQGRWFSLSGSIPPGGQAVLPTGEISALTEASGAFGTRTFDLEGELFLKSIPIVHRGGANVSVDETMAVYDDLSVLATEPAILTVEQGWAVDIQPDDPARTNGAAAMRRLFDKDERYRKVHEVGFGCNAAVNLVAANFFPNERHPSVHFGFGLGGYTAFHIDLVCPETRVYFETGYGSVPLYPE